MKLLNGQQKWRNSSDWILRNKRHALERGIWHRTSAINERHYGTVLHSLYARHERSFHTIYALMARDMNSLYDHPSFIRFTMLCIKIRVDGN